jgi:hypothetical protein
MYFLYVFPALGIVFVCAVIATILLTDSYDDPDENNFDNS